MLLSIAHQRHLFGGVLQPPRVLGAKLELHLRADGVALVWGHLPLVLRGVDHALDHGVIDTALFDSAGGVDLAHHGVALLGLDGHLKVNVGDHT